MIAATRPAKCAMAATISVSRILAIHVHDIFNTIIYVFRQ